MSLKIGTLYSPTVHKAQANEQSSIVRCTTPGCTRMLAISRKGFKGVKAIHAVCPNCIQRDIATCNSPEDVEQLENAFDAMRIHYEDLESSVSGNAGMIQIMMTEIWKMQCKLESDGSTQGIDAAGFGQFLAFAMPRIDEGIKDQISSNQDQHQQEYVSIVETLQQL